MPESSFKVGILFSFTTRAMGLLGKTINGFQRLTKAQKKFQEGMRRAADIRQAATGIATFAASARNALIEPIKRAEEFGAAISKVEALSGETGGTLNKLRDQALEMGAKTRFTATQAAEGLGFMAMAGFNANQMMATLPTTLSLAVAAGTDLGRTSDIMTDIMGAFGKEASEATDVADVLTRAFTGSNTTLETLFETMKLAGPIATDFGVSLEQVSTMAAILGSAGLKGSLGGTALRAFFARITAPRGIGKKALDFLKISPADLEGNLRDPLEILKEILEKTKDLGNVKKGQVLSALFGPRAMTGVSNLMRAMEKGTLQTMIDKMRDVNKTTKSVASIMDKNARGATIRLQSAIDGLTIRIGNALAPAVGFLKEQLIDLINWMTRLTEQYPTLTSVVFTAAGGLAIFATAVSGILFALGALVASKAFIVLGAGLAATIAPLALVAVKITVVAVAIWGLVEALKELKDIWDQLDFGEVLKGISESIEDVGMYKTVEGLLDPSGIVEIGSNVIESAKSAVGLGPERTTGVTETSVGGVIKLEVTGTGARVAEATATGGVDFDVDTGFMGEES